MSNAEAALSAYLRLLEQQGASEEVCQERQQLLLPLVEALQDSMPSEPMLYRKAVEYFLQQCLPENRVTALACAREFYYCWLGDVRKLAHMTAKSRFTTHNVRVEMSNSLNELHTRMADQQFAQFPPSLSIYLGELFEGGMSEVDIAEREYLLKALLFLLHEQVLSPASYRMVVDAMVLYLSSEPGVQTFLSLAREFFYYWMSFPFAINRRNAGV